MRELKYSRKKGRAPRALFFKTKSGKKTRKPGIFSGFYLWVVRGIFGAVLLSFILVLFFRWVPPPASAVMIQDYIGRAFSRQHRPPVRYHWVKYGNISPHLLIAVVAAEDQKFPRHWGFDVDAIVDAMEKNAHSRRLRGASTISQQVAKNLFLWSGRTYLRKGLEAYFTVLLESLWTKKRILEVYVNIAEFGDGVYGAGAAAERLLGKRPADLSRRDAARFAAVLPNPKRFFITNPSPYVRARERWIQGQMKQLGGGEYLKDL